MKTLLLIPSVLKTDTASAVAQNAHPRMDYHALADFLNGEPESRADLAGYAELERETHPLVRLLTRLGGRDAGLAALGFLRRKNYDVLFTNGENVGLPLALLWKVSGGKKRLGHVTIGHKPSTGKKRVLFTKLQREFDTIFVYARTQYDTAKNELGIDEKRLRLIPFHADDTFYKPFPNTQTNPCQISAAGLEWRDYPTLLKAVGQLPPETVVKLAAASPWSKHTNETEKIAMPPNVSARRYEYNELRDLYASSAVVAVPLYENDFQAGVTTLLEAMAMGKPVVVTQTTGQTDVVTNNENGLTVAPGDVNGWVDALTRLQNDALLRERLGKAAQLWIQENATLDTWVKNIARAIANAAPKTRV